ncbi:hypothetical protein Dxin01_00210 [Deinococcus xinjiangensis]|uniref:Phage protein n=1 Tax=Deinococcus xinjiangensis TaxID=457454 RepID=A0ABP9V5J8_9DEIO
MYEIKLDTELVAYPACEYPAITSSKARDWAGTVERFMVVIQKGDRLVQRHPVVSQRQLIKAVEEGWLIWVIGWCFENTDAVVTTFDVITGLIDAENYNDKLAALSTAQFDEEVQTKFDRLIRPIMSSHIAGD